MNQSAVSHLILETESGDKTPKNIELKKMPKFLSAAWIAKLI